MTGTSSMHKIAVFGQHDQCEVEGAVDCSSELDQVLDQLILFSAINHPMHEGLSL